MYRSSSISPAAARVRAHPGRPGPSPARAAVRLFLATLAAVVVGYLAVTGAVALLSAWAYGGAA